MTTYHTLAKPLERLPDGKVKWETTCGLKVSLPAQKFPVGTIVKTPDKYGEEIIECTACYAAVDETRTDEQIRAAQEREVARSQTGDLSGVQLDDDNFTPINEEVDEYPEK